MEDPVSIALSIADALPEEADARDELTALGMVAAGLICGIPAAQRSEIVRTFCTTLQQAVANDLH